MQLVKIAIFVPETHADVVRNALAEAGAGNIGNYSHCSFSVKGTGRFRPLPGANPAIGEVGETHEIAEERIEVVCEKERAASVIEAVRKVHPYEEMAHDVYPLLSDI